MTTITDFEKLAKVCDENDNFCVVCQRIREDCPVDYHLCYYCGGGEKE